jgi:hypothetical protein
MTKNIAFLSFLFVFSNSFSIETDMNINKPIKKSYVSKTFSWLKKATRSMKNAFIAITNMIYPRRHTFVVCPTCNKNQKRGVYISNYNRWGPICSKCGLRSSHCDACKEDIVYLTLPQMNKDNFIYRSEKYGIIDLGSQCKCHINTAENIKNMAGEISKLFETKEDLEIPINKDSKYEEFDKNHQFMRIN